MISLLVSEERSSRGLGGTGPAGRRERLVM